MSRVVEKSDGEFYIQFRYLFCWFDISGYSYSSEEEAIRICKAISQKEVKSEFIRVVWP